MWQTERQLPFPRRWQIRLRGTVQGVGFRPFVYRLAIECELAGWVINSTEGVSIEVEGEIAGRQTFLRRLEIEAPQR